ncbi:glycosyltransferase [Runella rosea]|uniref:Glycosyltransferase n=1 Tax=Runella rosea TaxID=2259595 RepID=A0A344TIR2_9BACT|nr:glycosyltransferase family 2 protein [Runella rosea]AXE18533.1 glycosyltransferase [Runella rosea]
MKVSIITVVFNGEKTIRSCIDSVLKQSYSDIEYIIIDGKSTDTTPEIVKSYGTKIAVFLSEKDAGIYDAMNKGIALATGEVIGILNADDFYHDSFVIEHIVDRLKETNAEAIYGDLIYVDAHDTGRVTRYWKSGNYQKSNFLFGWMPPHPTFFLRSSSYKKFGTYRLDLGSAADYELMLRMMYKHGISVTYQPQITTVMRTGGVSNKSLDNRLKANTSDRMAWTLNGIKPYWFTLWLKPLRKVLQFVYKPKYTE